MSAYRPQEKWSPYLLSAALPVGDVTHAVVILDGAMAASFDCRAASSGTGTIQVQQSEGGTWYNADAWEIASGIPTYRAAGTTITLAANDMVFVSAPTLHAVRFTLAGTSATIYGRTGESLTDFLLSALITAMIGGGAVAAAKGKQFTTITTSTSETTIVTAGAAGIFRDVNKLVCANISASQCNVTIKDATAGSTVDVIAVPAGETRGWTLPIDSAEPQTTAANNWTATCSASITSMLIAVGYVNR